MTTLPDRQADVPAGVVPESDTAGFAGEAPLAPESIDRAGARLTGRFGWDFGIFFSFRTNAFSRFLAALAAFFACLYALRARL